MFSLKNYANVLWVLKNVLSLPCSKVFFRFIRVKNTAIRLKAGIMKRTNRLSSFRSIL